MKKGKRRIAAMFLSLCMVFSLVTAVPAQAAGEEEQDTGLVVAWPDWGDDGLPIRSEDSERYWNEIGGIDAFCNTTIYIGLSQNELLPSDAELTIKMPDGDDWVDAEDGSTVSSYTYGDDNEVVEGIFTVSFNTVGEYRIYYNENYITVNTDLPMVSVYTEDNKESFASYNNEFYYIAEESAEYYIHAKDSKDDEDITSAEINLETIKYIDWTEENGEVERSNPGVTISRNDEADYCQYKLSFDKGLDVDFAIEFEYTSYSGSDKNTEIRKIWFHPSYEGFLVAGTNDDGGFKDNADEYAKSYTVGYGEENRISLAVVKDDVITPITDINALSIVDGNDVETGIEPEVATISSSYMEGDEEIPYPEGVYAVIFHGEGDYKIAYTDDDSTSYVNIVSTTPGVAIYSSQSYAYGSLVCNSGNSFPTKGGTYYLMASEEFKSRMLEDENVASVDVLLNSQLASSVGNEITWDRANDDTDKFTPIEFTVSSPLYDRINGAVKVTVNYKEENGWEPWEQSFDIEPVVDGFVVSEADWENQHNDNPGFAKAEDFGKSMESYLCQNLWCSFGVTKEDGGVEPVDVSEVSITKAGEEVTIARNGESADDALVELTSTDNPDDLNDENALYAKGVCMLKFKESGEYIVTYGNDADNTVKLNITVPEAAIYSTNEKDEANLLPTNDINYKGGDEYFIFFPVDNPDVESVEVYFDDRLGVDNITWNNVEGAKALESFTIPETAVEDYWSGVIIDIFRTYDREPAHIEYNLIPDKTGLIVAYADWDDTNGAPVAKADFEIFNKDLGQALKTDINITLALSGDGENLKLLQEADAANLKIVDSEKNPTEYELTYAGTEGVFNIPQIDACGRYYIVYTVGEGDSAQSYYVGINVDYGDYDVFALPVIDEEYALGNQPYYNTDKNVFYLVPYNIDEGDYTRDIVFEELEDDNLYVQGVKEGENAEDVDDPQDVKLELDESGVIRVTVDKDADYDHINISVPYSSVEKWYDIDDSGERSYRNENAPEHRSSWINMHLEEGKITYSDDTEAIIAAIADLEEMAAELPTAEEVTADDKDLVEAARAAFDAIGEKVAEGLGSFLPISGDALEEIESALEAAIKAETDKVAVAAVKEKIDALPAADKIAVSDKTAVEAARKVYDALTADQKKLVSEDTLKKLTDAEAAVKVAEEAKAPEEPKEPEDPATPVVPVKPEEQKPEEPAKPEEPVPAVVDTKASDDQKAADVVTSTINALPATVAVTDESAITAARIAYDALTADQKNLVSADTLKKLTDAEAALKAAKDAAATPVPSEVGTAVTDTSAGGQASSSTYIVTDKSTGAGDTGEVEYTGEAAASTVEAIVIPDTITGADGVTYEVTKIADNALKGNTTVKEVTVGNKIVEIGENAFQNATKLTKVTLGTNVTTIDKNAFAGCTKLKKVKASGSKITTVSDSAFKGDKALTTIDFSKSKIKTIGKNAFNGDKKLKTIKINGNSLTKVGKNAFKGIKKNATITINAKDKKTYNKVVKLIKKSGAKNVKYKFKKKK